MGKTGAVGAASKRAARKASSSAPAAKSGETFTGHDRLTRRQVEAVRAYQEESQHHDINMYLRRQALARPEVLETIRHIDASIARSKIEMPTVLYRGFPIAGRPSPEMLVGTSINDPAFYSTSTNRTIAEGFAGSLDQGVVLKIKVPAGQAALNVGKVATGSDFGEKGPTPEFEVLLPRGTKIRITAAKRIKSGRIVAQAEIVP
jgi:hypothetical protein